MSNKLEKDKGGLKLTCQGEIWGSRGSKKQKHQSLTENKAPLFNKK